MNFGEALLNYLLFLDEIFQRQEAVNKMLHF